MNILITAPSLDTSKNVSGISSVVYHIVQNSTHHFVHFQVGRKDNEKAGILWLLKQVWLVLSFPFHLRNIHIVHVNTALNPLSIFRDSFFVFLGRLFGKKVILHLHGGYYLMNDSRNIIIRSFINSMIGSANFLLVLSALEEKRMISKYPDKPIAFLVNSIPEEYISFNHNPKPLAQPLVITFLGRIHASKGVEDLVEAISILSSYRLDFSFHLYGSGPMKDYMVNELEAILGPKFSFKGVVGGIDKWKALDETDIFVLPSRHGEGLPMAMLEAMARGCVVMVTNDASITYAVEDNVNGFIISKYNPSDIAKKLNHLLDNRQALPSVTIKASETIRNKFNLKTYIKNLENIYGSI